MTVSMQLPVILRIPFLDIFVFGASIFIPGMSHIIAEIDFSRASHVITTLSKIVMIPNLVARLPTTGTIPTPVHTSIAAHTVIAIILAIF